MLRALLPTSIVAAAALALGPSAHAEWNRRIGDIRIVHPPGTPPGTWRALATVEVFLTDDVPVPSNYDFDLHLTLNGTIISTVSSGPLNTLNGPSCFFGGFCHVSSACNGIYNGAGYIPGTCYYGATGIGPLPLCGCATAMGNFDFGTQWSLRTTDTIGVTIVPTSTSMAELATADDTKTILVSDNVVGDTVCAGDGATTPTPCPCGNTGAAGHGCGNSQNAGGALLSATGWTELDSITGTDSVTLTGSSMPSTSSAIYLKSDGLNAAGSVFGDGVSCLSGAIIRLRTKINVGGASQFPEPGDPSVSVRGATPPGSGLTGYYATYYRNASAAFCPPATFNMSNAVAITW